MRLNLWPSTRAFLLNNQKYAFMDGKRYSFTARDSDDEKLKIKGAIDHTIQIRDSGFASATIEDKAICFKMTKIEVGQALTQVESEVKLMTDHLNYAPPEYVGWTCVKTEKCYRLTFKRLPPSLQRNPVIQSTRRVELRSRA